MEKIKEFIINKIKLVENIKFGFLQKIILYFTLFISALIINENIGVIIFLLINFHIFYSFFCFLLKKIVKKTHIINNTKIILKCFFSGMIFIISSFTTKGVISKIFEAIGLFLFLLILIYIAYLLFHGFKKMFFKQIINYSKNTKYSYNICKKNNTMYDYVIKNYYKNNKSIVDNIILIKNINSNILYKFVLVCLICIFIIIISSYVDKNTYRILDRIFVISFILCVYYFYKIIKEINKQYNNNNTTNYSFKEFNKNVDKNNYSKKLKFNLIKYKKHNFHYEKIINTHKKIANKFLKIRKKYLLKIFKQEQNNKYNDINFKNNIINTTNYSLEKFNKIFNERNYNNNKKHKVNANNFKKMRPVFKPEFVGGNGIAYEDYVARLLKYYNFEVQTTSTTGDDGVDLIAIKNGVRIAIQCKGYTSLHVGNKAVQEVFSGVKIYDCDIPCAVISTEFTKPAKEAAKKLNVILSHHDDIECKLEEAIMKYKKYGTY